MTYLYDDEHKDGNIAKVFDTSEWWAAIGSHAPDKREHFD
jgi:hypothetical protein